MTCLNSADKKTNLRLCFENAADFSPNIPSPLKSTARGNRQFMTMVCCQDSFWGNFQGVTPVNFVAIFNHTLKATSKWRIQLFSEENLSGITVFDSHFIPAWNFQGPSDFVNSDSAFSVKYLPGLVLARSFRVFVKDDNLANAEIGRFWAGEYLVVEKNPEYGAQLERLTTTQNERMESGSLFSENSISYRKLTFTLDMVDREAMETWSSYFALVGQSRDFFLSVFPETYNRKEMEYTLLGKFAGGVPKPVNDFYNNWSMTFEVEEI